MQNRERAGLLQSAGVNSGRRRVVVTGMGIVGPLGLGVENVWSRLIAGESGIGRITQFDPSDLPAHVAGEVPEGPTAEGKLTLSEWISPKDQRKMDRFIHMGWWQQRKRWRIPVGNLKPKKINAAPV